MDIQLRICLWTRAKGLRGFSKLKKKKRSLNLSWSNLKGAKTLFPWGAEGAKVRKGPLTLIKEERYLMRFGTLRGVRGGL